jgi:hypothetical protein
MVFACFEQDARRKAPVNPSLPTPAIGQANRKSRLPHELHKGRTAKKTGILIGPTASKLLALAADDCFRRN